MIVSIILEFQQKQMLLSRKSMEVQMNRKLKYYKGKGIMIQKSSSYLFWVIHYRASKSHGTAYPRQNASAYLFSSYRSFVDVST